MKEKILKLAKEAGEVILACRDRTSVEVKQDGSPVTFADKASHDLLSKELKGILDIPVLSEEKIIDYDIRKKWEMFWLIDPLDGTKEFIHGYNDFCINIALIKNQKPILGAIYAPALEQFFYAEERKGFFCENVIKEPAICNRVATVSRFHNSDRTKEFMSLNGINETVEIGAALKFCHLASGKAQFYPRFEGSKEWDIAAGHLILKEAGGAFIDLETGEEPLYNKQNIRNNFFIAWIGDKKFNEFKLMGE